MALVHDAGGPAILVHRRATLVRLQSADNSLQRFAQALAARRASSSQRIWRCWTQVLAPIP
jgi:hypothetical protein